MQDKLEDKTIDWNPNFNNILGLEKNSFHRIYEDDYEDKFMEISQLLKRINDNVKNFFYFYKNFRLKILNQQVIFKVEKYMNI